MSKALELFETHKNICSSKRILPESKDLYLKYAALSDEDETELVRLALNWCTSNAGESDTLEAILSHISMFSRGNSLRNIYADLIRNKVLYPPEIFLKATESEAKLLIELLKNTPETNSIQINHILMCLSHIPCDLVKDFLLASSRENKPSWTKCLHVLPIDYSECGGWTLDGGNHIKKLYKDDIIAFKRSSDSSSEFAPIKKQDDVCPFCGNNIYIVYHTDFDISTCLFCSCYQVIYTEVDKNGLAHWHDKNQKSSILETILARGTELAPFGFGLMETKEHRLPTYTVSQFTSISKSQIGGLPTLINDITYPLCPDCGEKMLFIAQLDTEDVDEYGEGMYYFYHCKNCNTVASTYDQT